MFAKAVSSFAGLVVESDLAVNADLQDAIVPLYSEGLYDYPM